MPTVIENRNGFFGDYGGQYVPETLMTNLIDLENAFMESQTDREFQERYQRELADYVGRPSPLYLAENLSREWGGKVYLKREDCNHTGAHKINNAIGQTLLALKLGKNRVVAETGAGQHGVATAAACARLGLECVVYMGALDCQRQLPNVQRMRLLGAEVHACESGSRNLKVAINEAIRDWIANPEDTHYLIGSVVGPHPYPLMVREFQAMIGREAKVQIVEHTGLLPDAVIACVGGGSNAMGIFHDFVNEDVKLYGVEAAGKADEPIHSAPLHSGTPGVLHGAMQYLLQSDDGQIQGSHSIAPGLDYPGVGPEHSALKDAGRVEYCIANDDEALAAFKECSKLEGIIPALESSHALAFGRRLLNDQPGQTIIINLSGRGDKDLPALLEGGLL